jgi:osomolarity two-component system phosphorelay intermediate protein YPD1
MKDETGTKDITEEVALKKLEDIIKQTKDEFHEVEKVLKEFYNDDEDDDDDNDDKDDE